MESSTGEKSYLQKPEKIYTSHPELVEEKIKFYKEKYEKEEKLLSKDEAKETLEIVLDDLLAHANGVSESWISSLEEFSKEDIQSLGLKLIDFSKEQGFDFEKYRLGFDTLDINLPIERTDTEF